MAAKKKKEELANISEMYDLIGENDSNQGVSEYLSSGIMTFNKMLSGKYHDGGFGVKRIHEVFGPESSGKTLIATRALIEAQKKDGFALFLDHEHSFDSSFAIRQGLKTDKGSGWFYKQPITAEDSFTYIEEVANKMVQSYPNTHICVVLDSIASMKTKYQMETGFDSNMKANMDLASTMSRALGFIVPIVSSCKMTLIFLNQTRVNPKITFGDSKITAGGEAMKFYASTRSKISKTGKVKNGDEIIGENVKVMSIKNKIYRPFQTCEYVTDTSEKAMGVDLIATHMPDFLNKGIVAKAGSWYSMNGERIGQGMDKVKQMFEEHPHLYDEAMKLTYVDET